MRPLSIIIVILLIAVAAFYFTKPSDAVCRNEAMKIVTGEMVNVPGYSDPNVIASATVPQADKVLIEDRFLWKKVSYVYPASVERVGNGYLGSFHPSKMKTGKKK